jgi:hypothetical protein
MCNRSITYRYDTLVVTGGSDHNNNNHFGDLLVSLTMSTSCQSRIRHDMALGTVDLGRDWTLLSHRKPLGMAAALH